MLCIKILKCLWARQLLNSVVNFILTISQEVPLLTCSQLVPQLRVSPLGRAFNRALSYLLSLLILMLLLVLLVKPPVYPNQYVWPNMQDLSHFIPLITPSSWSAKLQKIWTEIYKRTNRMWEKVDWSWKICPNCGWWTTFQPLWNWHNINAL